MLKNITLCFSTLLLLLNTTLSFSENKLLYEAYVGESDILDRKFISMDIGGYTHKRNSFNGFYLKGRIVSISEPFTSYVEDSSGIYIGAGLAAHSYFSPYIEAGIDIIDLIDIIIDENLDKNRECEKTNTCEHIHRDAYIKTGVRVIISKQLLIGAFYERIAITNDDTIGSPFHNVAGISIGYLF